MLTASRVFNLSVIDYGEEKCVPRHSYGPAVRSFYLIHFVYSGEGVLEVDNRTWKIQAGQSFLIYPGETAFYQADAQHPWHYAWIGYMGDSSAVLTQMVGFSRGKRVLPVSYPEQAWQVLTQMCSDIKHLQLGELATLGGLFRFLSLISSIAGDNVILNLTQYEKAIHYMQENFSHAISVQSIASAVNLSRSQLFRVFKNACGESPQHVLEEMRLSHAVHLLRKTDLPVEAIAQYAGYGSSSYLNKVFQKRWGMSPTAYRLMRRQRLSNTVDGDSWKQTPVSSPLPFIPPELQKGSLEAPDETGDPQP